MGYTNYVYTCFDHDQRLHSSSPPEDPPVCKAYISAYCRVCGHQIPISEIKKLVGQKWEHRGQCGGEVTVRLCGKKMELRD